ncbi:DUF6896 domain-containing protein [Xanthocytophaga agilis]|uniref:DUF6896 domain-containing protein n=1 Tax=Xanthocytophaga agilis TaxID=3048010 RepID=A0AAE3QWQ1_9BACT|nr:hypothetical protein [Xanthocytophaga agilis]MDJ1499469.1 hypothetical protein [Xanthocytophaga agilis]
MEIEKAILTLIEDYSAKVYKATDLLLAAFGDINFIYAKNQELIPRKGFLDENQSIRFAFSATGCLVEGQEGIINFDLNFINGKYNQRHDGFSVWRLYGLLQQRISNNVTTESYPA